MPPDCLSRWLGGPEVGQNQNLARANDLAVLLFVDFDYYPAGIHGPLLGFTMALLISTCSIASIGFLIASLVPTARFAQPIGAAIMYPMIAVSGLFAPIQSLPPAGQAVAKVLPLTYAVSLLEGIWKGDTWWRTRATWQHWRWRLWYAPRSRQKCFAGSSKYYQALETSFNAEMATRRL